MLIRKATQDDYENVVRLLEYLNPDDPIIPRSKSMTIFTDILNSSNFIITIAEKNNSIVGTCYINIIPNLTRSASPYAIIENVVTHPDHRRQGVGKALIDQALRYAKSRKCYKVMLLTGRDEKVQEFYKSCGMKNGNKTAFIKRWDQNITSSSSAKGT